jgi:hypothetical protein
MTTTNRDSLTIADRVARGVALLDTHLPDWHQQISVEFLDLASCSECVLGQLFGAFEAGVAALGISVDFTLQEEARHGFDIRCHEGRDVYDELRAEWLRVITERRLAVAS